MQVPSSRRSVRFRLRRLHAVGAAMILALALAPRAAYAQVKASDAKAFVGSWTLPLQTQNGTFSMDIKISEGQGGMLAATVSGQGGDQQVDKLSLSGKMLTLDYSLDYQGTPVPVEITLTPAESGLAANLDFASGQYTMSGTATKAAS